MAYKITVIPGDGIGKEITDAAVKVLKKTDEKFQLGLSYILFSAAVKHASALDSILVPTIEPLLNPIWVFILIGERPGPWAVVGGAIVLVAVTARSFVMARSTPSVPLPD